MTEKLSLQTNHSLLRELAEFTDLLFKELLTQRCDPEELFCLPGLPVTNRELLASMVTNRSYAKSSQRLCGAWGHLFRSVSADVGEQPRLSKLCRIYRLSEAWVLAVVLSFAYQLDPKYQKAVAALQGDSGRKGIDCFLLRAMAAYLQIQDENGILALTAESRTKSTLFEDSNDSRLFLRSNVAAWLLGLDCETTLEQNGFTLCPVSGESSVIRKEEIERVSAVAKQRLEHFAEKPLVFELQGRIGSGKKRFSQNVAEKLGFGLCVIRPDFLPAQSRHDRSDLLNQSCFACRVNGCIPYLDLTGCTQEDNELFCRIEAVLREFPLVFIATLPEQNLTGRLSVAAQRLSLDRLSMEDNLALWRQIGSRYPVADEVVYEQLAGRYRLLPSVIAEVFYRAEQRRMAQGEKRIGEPLLLSCLRECNKRFENTLMERIDTVFCWKDLKVKPETVRAMQLACAHLKHRFAAQEYLGSRYPYGTGVSVLMYGPPGTGKTMAAQVIANELQMDLYRVDLSQISSKYIGETEKNLEKVFREAEQSNVILFFDEADSIFGKRTEVKDSNDKYANQETSYILQRIESYDGMVILATNLARNFDPAFMRRITVSIQFELPDVDIRLQMWRDMLRNTELADNETTLQSLAQQFELSGSNIKSIVRNAVFMALMEGSPLSVAHIAMAIKFEFEKLGKIVNASGLGTFYSYIG